MILGVNSSCSSSHLPSQYGSNPSGGTQTILIFRRTDGIASTLRDFLDRAEILDTRESNTDVGACKVDN